MGYLIGIDGGGTRTTLALADGTGRELLRRAGPAGLVDPRRPAATAEMLAQLARDAFAEAGVRGPAAALCAGLAGVGNPAEREVVHEGLARAGVADRVLLRSDGETALHGALSGGPGVLLVAGTGSIAYARSPDGRVLRCGGWGQVVGDEGSGYDIGRSSLQHALRAADGRGPRTELLPAMLAAIGADAPEMIPPWALQAAKSDIAGLAVHTLRLAAAGDAVALDLVRSAAARLAEHAAALLRRLEPVAGDLPVVLHGGVASDAGYAACFDDALRALQLPLRRQSAAADAVAGAVAFAREAAEAAA